MVPWPYAAGLSATAYPCVLPMVIALSSALMRVVERSARLVYRTSATGLAPCLTCCQAVRTYHSTSHWLDRITTLALSLENEMKGTRGRVLWVSSILKVHTSAYSIPKSLQLKHFVVICSKHSNCSRRTIQEGPRSSRASHAEQDGAHA